MKPAPFEYFAPRTLDEALNLLATFGEDSRVIAGGQSLGPMLNLRVVRPSHLIDISRIESLRELRILDSGGLWIGAAVRHAEIEDTLLPGRIAAILRSVASGIAYRSVRNRGTVGGSLAHADPAADWPAVLCSLSAQAHVVSNSSRRVIELRDFIQGVYETSLTSGDILEAVEVPAIPETTTWAFGKEVNHHGGFATALAACLLRPDGGGALWLGAAGPRPIDMSTVLTHASRHGTTDSYARIAERLEGEADGDMPRYRRHLHTLNATATLARALAS